MLTLSLNYRQIDTGLTSALGFERSIVTTEENGNM